MATYTNKFMVHTGDVIRITFFDERAAAEQGGKPSTVEVGEQIMTRDNAVQLGELLVKLLKETLQ
jgi:hypothetical protein